MANQFLLQHQAARKLERALERGRPGIAEGLNLSNTLMPKFPEIPSPEPSRGRGEHTRSTGRLAQGNTSGVAGVPTRTGTSQGLGDTFSNMFGGFIGQEADPGLPGPPLRGQRVRFTDSPNTPNIPGGPAPVSQASRLPAGGGGPSIPTQSRMIPGGVEGDVGTSARPGRGGRPNPGRLPPPAGPTTPGGRIVDAAGGQEVYMPSESFVTGTDYALPILEGLRQAGDIASEDLGSQLTRGSEALRASLASRGLLNSGVGAAQEAALLEGALRQQRGLGSDIFNAAAGTLPGIQQNAAENAFRLSGLGLDIGRFNVGAQTSAEEADLAKMAADYARQQGDWNTWLAMNQLYNDRLNTALGFAGQFAGAGGGYAGGAGTPPGQGEGSFTGTGAGTGLGPGLGWSEPKVSDVGRGAASPGWRNLGR